MWTLRGGTSEARNRTFSRPLSDNEASFHWDSVLNGTADQICKLSISVQRETTDENFREAWLAVKRHFPILGAHVEERESGEVLEFVVHEAQLSNVRAGEMVSLQGGEEAALFVKEEALNGQRKLSNDLLASIAIIRPPSHGSTLHIVLTIAHLIIDGIGNFNLIRKLLEFLASPDRGSHYRPSLDDRLSMALSSSSLSPLLNINPARRRWRNAAARILWERTQRGLIGGHGLPRRFIAHSATTPAISRQAVITLPAALWKTFIQSCRDNSITFGHAYAVLAQLALSRLLHRQYFRGQMEEDEWQTRLRQPIHTGGPLNLRPYLREDWVAAGGERELNIHIGFYFTSSPFIARASPEYADATGAPSFSSLLSHQRFYLRCQLIKRQMAQVTQRPLFFETIVQHARPYKEGKRKDVMIWRRRQGGEEIPEGEATRKAGYTRFAFGGSSLGQVDKWLPREYPVSTRPGAPEAPHPTGALAFYDTQKGSATASDGEASRESASSGSPASTSRHSEPELRLLKWTAHLRCRPTELYLGSTTWNGLMNMYVYYDGNVYDQAIVEEWLQDIKDAATWYLGGVSIDESARGDNELAKEH